MKLQANKADYDVSDVLGIDHLENARICCGDARTDPSAYTYVLSVMPWDMLTEVRKKSAEKNKGAQRVGMPVYLAMTPDHATLGLYPCPNEDCEVEIFYSTLNKL